MGRKSSAKALRRGAHITPAKASKLARAPMERMPVIVLPKDLSAKTEWTDPLRFQQAEIGRNQTLGVQKKLYRMVIEDSIKPGQKVLEVGAGRGWFQKHIVPEPLKKGWHEFDISHLALKQSPGAKRVAGTALELPFADGSIDAVVDSSAIDILEPERHRKLARELKRVLKPGGKVISFQDATPNPAIWAPEISKAALNKIGLGGGAEISAKAHDRFSEALSGNLEKEGFTTVTRQPLFGDGIFPREKRHGIFAEPVASTTGEEARALKGAKAYKYWDGVWQPMAIRPDKAGMVPEGHVLEMFRGRLLIMQKPDNKVVYARQDVPLKVHKEFGRMREVQTDRMLDFMDDIHKAFAQIRVHESIVESGLPPVDRATLLKKVESLEKRAKALQKAEQGFEKFERMMSDDELKGWTVRKYGLDVVAKDLSMAKLDLTKANLKRRVIARK